MQGGSILTRRIGHWLSAIGYRLWAIGVLVALLAACAAPPPPPLPTVPPAPTLAGLAPTGVAQDAPLQIAELTPYEHPSGVVTVRVPAGWELRNASRPDEINLAWIDAQRNGGVLLSVFEDPNPYTVDQLGVVLSGFLARSYGDLPAFRADVPIPQSDGGVRLAWGYGAATPEAVVPLVGTSVISQQGNKVVILSVLLPAAEAPRLAEAAEQILTGYKLNPEAPLIP